MGLSAIRHVALPGVRTARATFVSVLLMVAVVLGLVAMHDRGPEHVAHVAPATAVAGAHIDEHAASSPVPPAETMTAVVAGATAVGGACDSGCVADLLGCAAAAVACAMMIAFGVLLALASRPAMFRRLLDAGEIVRAVVRSLPGHLRPDLHVLSISRT
jgi:hypothetical protein